MAGLSFGRTLAKTDHILSHVLVVLQFIKESLILNLKERFSFTFSPEFSLLTNFLHN